MAVSFTWLGHSAFLFEIDGHSVLIDPWLTNPLSPVQPDEVPADIILLTHGHSDHLGETVDIARRTNALVVAPVELCDWLNGRGCERTWDGNIGGTYRGDYLTARFTYALHSSSWQDLTYLGPAVGYVIEAGGKRVYFAGDTGLFGDMRLIGERGLDAAFLPIGDKYTMGIEDSIEAVRLLNPRHAVPMHFNTFPPLAQDVTHWARRVNNETKATPIINDPGYAFLLE